MFCKEAPLSHRLDPNFRSQQNTSPDFSPAPSRFEQENHHTHPTHHSALHVRRTSGGGFLHLVDLNSGTHVCVCEESQSL
jgi:hypothetical protein